MSDTTQSAETIDLVSIGYAASLLQISPSLIREIAESEGVQPSFRINEIPHYDRVGFDRIAKVVRLARATPQATATEVEAAL